MSVRTKRARMLYKLMFVLGPDFGEYLKDDGKEPFTFSEAVNHTLSIFGHKFWIDNRDNYDGAKAQLLTDYADLISIISDDNLSEKI